MYFFPNKVEDILDISRNWNWISKGIGIFIPGKGYCLIPKTLLTDQK